MDAQRGNAAARAMNVLCLNFLPARRNSRGKRPRMKSAPRWSTGPLCAAVVVLQGMCGPVWAEDRWSGQIAATSDYVFRGVSQTDGHPAVQGSLAYRTLSGFYIGAWASSLDKNDWFYPAGTAEVEIDVFAGFGHAFSDNWSVDMQTTA